MRKNPSDYSLEMATDIMATSTAKLTLYIWNLFGSFARCSLGYAAFAELRYENAEEVATKGEQVKVDRGDFVLNQDGYNNGVSKILIAGDNFGCGSSREHAPWAINDLGLRCIISTR